MRFDRVSMFEYFEKAIPVVLAMLACLRTGLRFKRVGRHAKIYGAPSFVLGADVALGDFCWLEAVRSYRGVAYEPRLVFGDRVAISDLTHISCVHSITIGEDCLLGSKIYIGDHSHGSTRAMNSNVSVAPAMKPLDDIAAILIGARTWIGDGAVILAGTSLAPDSIVAANSVVKLKEERAALIAGVPARVIRYLDNASEEL